MECIGWGQQYHKKYLVKRNEKKEKEEMKRKKIKGKEGFPIKDQKKLKRKRLEENRIIPDQ